MNASPTMYRKAAPPRKLVNIMALALGSALIAGCPRPVKPPTDAPVEAAPEVARGATVYLVDANASTVLIHVFRGGALARLGHNHVIASKNLRGRIWLHPTLAKSGFELSFPVAKLIVDDPQLRAAAGADFASEIKEEDKEGTRRNMLRAEVLDSERYPEVKLRSVRVGGTVDAPTIAARITIRDASREIEIPAKIAREGERLRATGAFDVKQTDFGIKPFSVALGALEVQDRLHIRFDVVAQKD